MASSYEALIPAAARGVPVRELEEGTSSTPPLRVELRRWTRPFVPLDYQSDIIRGLGQLLDSGSVAGLLNLPTGSGKTVTTSYVLLDALGKLDDPASAPTALWIAPQIELLHQAIQGIQSAWWSGTGPSIIDLVIVKDNLPDTPLRPTVFLCTAARARQLSLKAINNLRCAVFDEAHHVAGNEFQAIWDTCRKAIGTHRSLALGLSATPLRSIREEQSLLVHAFESKLFVPRSLHPTPISELLKRGVLSAPTFERIPCDIPHARHKSGSERRTLAQLSRDADRWQSLVDYVKCSDERTVVFAPNRQFGKAFCQHLRFLGKHAEYIDGDARLADRLGVFERFSAGSTSIVVNVALFIEGVDCPAAQRAVLTYPIGSRVRLAQIIGRVLRGPAMGGTSSATIAGIEGNQSMIDDTIELRPYDLSAWRNVEVLG